MNHQNPITRALIFLDLRQSHLRRLQGGAGRAAPALLAVRGAQPLQRQRRRGAAGGDRSHRGGDVAGVWEQPATGWSRVPPRPQGSKKKCPRTPLHRSPFDIFGQFRPKI